MERGRERERERGRERESDMRAVSGGDLPGGQILLWLGPFHAHVVGDPARHPDGHPSEVLEHCRLQDHTGTQGSQKMLNVTFNLY